MPAALEDQITAVNRQIQSITTEAQTAWAEFDRFRTDLANADVTADDGSEALEKAEEKHRAYAEKADRLQELAATRDRLWAMTGEKHRPDGPDKLAREQIKDIGHSTETWGRRIAQSDEYAAALRAEMFKDRGDNTNMPDVKLGKAASREELHALVAVGDVASSPIASTERRDVIRELPEESLALLQLVNVTSTDDDVIEIVREKAFTNNAAFVPEASSERPIGSTSPTVNAQQAGLKPLSAIELEVVKVATSVVAHGMAVTRKTLKNKARVQSLIDGKLRSGLLLTTQTAMVTGDGQDDEFLGLLNTPGIPSHSRASESGDNRMDAIHRAITKVRVRFREPSATGMNPLTWEEIRLAKNGNGDYYMGPPAMAGATTLWGKPVVAHNAFPEAVDLVGDFAEVELAIRTGIEVLASDSHADYFLRNITTLLAEFEAAFAVHDLLAFQEVVA